MWYSSYITKGEAVDDLNGSNRAVVAGGTQGIGAGIALKFALAGSSVWIIGRSEERGAEVVKKLQQASLEGARRRQRAGDAEKPDFDFFKADLSDVEEVKRVAGEVKKRAGSKGIDWLFETQGAFRSLIE
jgi:NAD(P)-dependent dehydrogenase (short-subunit alcohol dehydrogenase family)